MQHQKQKRGLRNHKQAITVFALLCVALCGLSACETAPYRRPSAAEYAQALSGWGQFFNDTPVYTPGAPSRPIIYAPQAPQQPVAPYYYAPYR